MQQSSSLSPMGPNMSKYIPYINMNKNSPKQAFKNRGIHNSMMHKTLRMQNSLPKLRTLQVLTREDHENERENAVIKRGYEKWLPPQA